METTSTITSKLPRLRKMHKGHEIISNGQLLKLVLCGLGLGRHPKALGRCATALVRAPCNPNTTLRVLQQRLYVYGERIVDRIEYEELALKSMDTTLGPKLSELGRTGGTAVDEKFSVRHAQLSQCYANIRGTDSSHPSHQTRPYEISASESR